METADNGAPAAPLHPSSQDDENNSASSQLSPNNHQSPSQIDPALLTQLPPTAGIDGSHFCNTQSSMPLESQCSQLMLATQNYNDSMLQTQLSRNNNHHGMDDDEEDAVKFQSSQHLMLATQTTHEKMTQCYGDVDDLSVKGDHSQPNTQENSSQLEHLSMTQQQQSLLLTQQQQQERHGNDLTSTNIKEQECGKFPQQSHDENNDTMSSPSQQTNEHDFLYNTQQNDVQLNIDDESDDDSDNDNMERLVEEQNLAVSLSMEVIEESQRSRDNSVAHSSSLLCNIKHGGNVDLNDVQTGQLTTAKEQEPCNPPLAGFGFISAGSGKSIAVNEEEMAKADKLLADDVPKTCNDFDCEEHDELYNPPAAGFGFTNVGSGKSIAVNEEEMAKANKLLADDDRQQKTSNSYEEHDEPYNPPAAGLGFTNVGSGKSIAVNEEEMAKADKLLADDTQLKSDEYDHEEHDEQYNPPAAGLGFMNVGSGKSIAVNEEEMAKADKLLADDTQQKTSHDSEYEEHDEPYNPPAAGFGFTNVGSGKSIAVNEEEMAKANKLLADDTQQKTSHDSEYDGQDEPYNPPAAGFGFTNVGSGKSIAVNEEEMAKANKLLADDDLQQKTSHDSEYDGQDEPYNPPAAGFGFTNVGSGKSIAVNEEEMAKANKLLADDTQQKTSHDSEYDGQDEPYNPPAAGFGFTNVGSGKSIAVNEEEMAKANKLLADDDLQQKTSHDSEYDGQDEPYNPPATGFGFTNVGSGKSIAVNEEEMAKADKLLADDTQQKTSHDSEYDGQDEPYNPPATGFGFTNVGSGKSISVDEEELAKADKMLAEDYKYTSSSTTTTAPLVVASKMTPKYQRSQQANPATVTNPYVRKRSIVQISNACADKSNVANAAVSRANLTAPTPSRRLVFNPYAKTGQSTTKAVVRNPYAKLPIANVAADPRNASVAIPPSSKPSQLSSTVPSNPIAQTVTNASSVIPPTPNVENQFRFKGISFSLPIAERLPSRNVSYKPAEILTVGELHQYLYGANASTDFKHLQSVRITGTLLSVAVSSSDEKDGTNGSLYSSGTFLLIGDPLEKNHSQTKPLPPKVQNVSSHSVVPRPTSILRNKHTPIVRTKQPTLISTTDGKPIATPVVAKQSNPTANTTIKKKPALRGGLLNNSKPKKFVYAGNKSRSSLGGGLHRKFVTPKRGPTLAAPNTTGRVTSSVTRNRPLSMVKSVGLSSGRKKVKIETVIQCHPAPLVPVWIGSSLDDDGLDGSVVNDLVMIMGEIVVEHCSRCCERSEKGSVTVDEESTSIQGNKDGVAEEIDSPSSELGKQQATAVKNVRDSALLIAATASNNTKSTSSSTKKRPFCSRCVCFLSARIVKNANGTDMNLQKESLRVRREYFIKRNKQMECLMNGMATDPAIYSVGCGPFENDNTVIGSN